MPSAELTYTPEAADPEAIAWDPATRRRGRAAIRAIAMWLLRVLADSAGAWALAAGAPPNPHD